MTDLPSGWAEATVGDLFNYVRGVTYSKADATKVADTDRLPVLRANNFNQSFDLTDLVFLPSDMIAEDQKLREGDLLFAMSSGSKSHVGKCILVKQQMNAGFGAFCGALRPTDAAFSRLFNNAFQSKAFRNYIEELAAGTNINNLKRDLLLGYKIPVPPLNEQHRIVEKIEAMFDDIDAGVQSLQTARAALGLYRQSLLKSAFEGRLTADWRAQNADKLEAPETLLARIQKERDARYKAALDAWQETLAAWRADGEKGKKPAKPKRPKTETNQPLFEVVSVSNLPSSWAAPKLVEVIDIVSGSTPKGVENCTGSGVPFFKVSDMNTVGNERTMISAQVNASHEEAAFLGLPICPTGTVVFPKRGGAILTNKKRRLGKPSSFDLNTMGLVNRTDTVHDEYLWFWMLSVSLSDIYDGSNVPQINNKNVEPISFPIFSSAEQAEIVRLLDARLEAADALEAEIDAALTRADALRQSILKKAFSGQLVPQDPNDEPASALLERIKADRAKAPKAKKRNAAHA